jgi:hypothetical protein
MALGLPLYRLETGIATRKYHEIHPCRIGSHRSLCEAQSQCRLEDDGQVRFGEVSCAVVERVGPGKLLALADLAAVESVYAYRPGD